MSDAPEIVSIGHVIREHIVFPDKESEEVLGSPAAYTSVTLARLGARVGVVSRIGPDMPAHLLAPLRDAGVDLRGLHARDDDVTTATRLVYDGQGGKQIFYPEKATPICASDVPDDFRQASLLYICTMDNDVLLPEIKKIKSWDRKMAVDLGGYGGAHVKPEPRDPGLPKDFPELIAQFHIVKVSDEDCRRILADPDADDEALGRRILEFGAEIFVATRGPEGALVLTKDQRIPISPYKGHAIDPTGGGDTYMAGFLFAYLESGDPEYSGRYGAATALCVIERTGGVHVERMPSADEVAECMKRPTV